MIEQGSSLSDDERRVLRLVVDGRTDQQIGRALGMSERTVRRLVDGLRVKLDAPNRAALGYRAGIAGIVFDIDAGDVTD